MPGGGSLQAETPQRQRDNTGNENFLRLRAPVLKVRPLREVTPSGASEWPFQTLRSCVFSFTESTRDRHRNFW